MAEIVKVLKETMPAVKLIGRMYTEAERDPQTAYGAKWQEWFENGYFDVLKQCKGIERVSDDMMGVMRLTEQGVEYWIGMFMSPDDTVPEGFSSAMIPAGELGVCYVYGRDDNGELFGMGVHKACCDAWAAQGWTVTDGTWFIERYHASRYANADEKGNVILDYCAYFG